MTCLSSLLGFLLLCYIGHLIGVYLKNHARNRD